MNVNDISEAPADGPTRLAVHGVEGWGKTTLAFFFPRPVFLAAEQFAPRDLPWRPKRFPTLAKWEDAFAAVASLTNDKHDRETVIVDTVDWLESLIHRFICKRDSNRKSEMNKAGHELISIEDYGYGKGYVAAGEEFRRWIRELDVLQHKRNMNVVLLMHSHIKKFENPGGVNFDRWTPKMHHIIARIVTEYAENVIFGFYEVVAGKLDEKDKKAKGVDTGRRMIGTQHNVLYDAKNRMNLPPVMELKQPEDMIPWLLGEHLRGAEPPTFAAGADGSAPQPQAKAPDDEPAAQTVAEPEVAEPEPAKVEPEVAPLKAQPLPEGYEEPKADAKLTPPPEKKKTAAEAKKESAEQIDLTRRLLEARKLAEDFNAQFGANVVSWIEQAKGDPKKIEAIIKRVNDTTTVQASA